ncbi:MAG: uroporphyrinogen-III C-methyltransferase [Acetobacteraceae bacterium]
MTAAPPAASPPWAQAAARLLAPVFTPGSVSLAGAGPGDPGLLTLHAAHALATADVVLHDALIPPAILELAATSHLEPVGKRAGRAGASQLRINQRLITLAQQGLRVLRLKGGDPLIFGRGAEEALALLAAGIPFRIIPGVSAGIGGAAAAGIPLTHRGMARTVTFATGHDCHGRPPGDLAPLSRGAEVLVFYMALRQAGPIAAALIAAGRPPDEPVAFLADATTPDQRVITATLGTAGAAAATLPRSSPTLIVVGPVVAFHDLFAPLLAPMTIAARQAALPA